MLVLRPAMVSANYSIITLTVTVARELLVIYCMHYCRIGCFGLHFVLA